MLRFTLSKFKPSSAKLTPNTDRRKIIRKFGLDPDEAKKNLIVIGCDETGTGCLAGPLMASAFCVLPSSSSLSSSENETESPSSSSVFELPDNILDSKAVSSGRREKLFQDLMRQQRKETSNDDDGDYTCVSATSVASVELIDDIQNITRVRLGFLSNAVNEVVQKVKALPSTKYDPSRHFFCVVVDGQEMPEDLPLDFPMCVAIPKGDTKYMCVAAASIIAKVTRDREMIRLGNEEYPGWGFEDHKGYGSKVHVEKCIANSPDKLTPIHRKTFTQNLKSNQESRMQPS